MTLKKTVGALLGAAALTISLVACGGSGAPSSTGGSGEETAVERLSAAVVGSWEFKSGEIDGEEITEEMYDEIVETEGLTITLDLDESGSAVFDIAGDVSEGTWEIKDDTTITIEIEGDPADATIDGDELTIAVDGSSMTFEKVSDTPGEGGDSDKGSESIIGEESEGDVDDEFEYYFTEKSVGEQDAYVSDGVEQTATLDIEIADDETVCMTVVGMGEDFEGDTGYFVQIENRSDTDFYVTNVSAELDGEDVYDYATLARVVPAGETHMAFFYFDSNHDVAVDEDSSFEALICLFDVDFNEHGYYLMEV